MKILKELDKTQQTSKIEHNRKSMNKMKKCFKNRILILDKNNNKFIIIKFMGYFKHINKIRNLIISKIIIFNNKIWVNNMKALIRIKTKSMRKILTIRFRKFRKNLFKSHFNNKEIKNKMIKILQVKEKSLSKLSEAIVNKV